MSVSTLTTVTPVYNGVKYLEDLILQIEAFRLSLEQQGSALTLIESIFVIDECIDDSAELLYQIQKEKPWVRIIELSKNFGQHPATVAGILYSSGDWIATLDEDLQHKPNYILDLLKTSLKNSSDVCYAKSGESIHDSIVKDKITIFSKKFLGYLISNKNVSQFNSFRVMRGSLARAAASISNYDSYFDVILTWYTDRMSQCDIPLRDLRNATGESSSGYSFMSLLKHGKKVLTTSKIKIFRAGLIIGFLSFLLSLILSVYALISRLLNPEKVFITEWSSIMVSILFFGGLLSLLTGIIIELMSDAHLQSKGKPSFYVVDRSRDMILFNQIKEYHN